MATVPPRPPAEPPIPAASGPVRVMQLRVWLDADAAWCACLVMPDARVHEFSSPFALVRHLSRLLHPSACADPSDGAGPGGPGLR